MIATKSPRWLSAAAGILVLPLAGCSMAPDYDILGSLFPAWLVCVALGVLFAVIIHFALLRFQIRLLYPLLAYPCVAAVFTFAIWLIVY